MLQTYLNVMLLLFFFQELAVCFAFIYNISDAPLYYGHVVRRYMNCYGITNLLLQKFTFIENEDYDSGKNLNINHKIIWHNLI